MLTDREKILEYLTNIENELSRIKLILKAEIRSDIALNVSVAEIKEPVLTLETVRLKLKAYHDKLLKTYTKDEALREIKSLMHSYETNTITNLDKDRYTSFYKKLEALI